MNKLVQDNISFVEARVKSLNAKYVSHNELVKAGIVGLTIAARKYKDTQQVNFPSFALYYVNREIFSKIQKKQRVILLLKKGLLEERRQEYQISKY